MFGPPKDVEGECNARLELGDDYGDNSCTFRCSLPAGHEGRHEEKCRTDSKGPTAHNVIMTWEGDDEAITWKNEDEKIVTKITGLRLNS